MTQEHMVARENAPEAHIEKDYTFSPIQDQDDILNGESQLVNAIDSTDQVLPEDPLISRNKSWLSTIKATDRDRCYSNTLFKHQPLDHSRPSIRLLEISPYLSTGDDLIQCTITHADLSKEYVCLSYTWGSENDQYWIKVNGSLFCVRRNLLGFLAMARAKFPRQSFWIDAVCIDQVNIGERNHQVQQMAEIYKHATRVFAWLGDGNSIESFINVIFKTSKMNTMTQKQWELCLENQEAEYERFFKHDYWTRSWVIQEIAVAKSAYIVAGQSAISLSRLERFIDMSFDDDIDKRDVVAILDSTKWRGSLLDLLAWFRNAKCQNRHDRIYSLVGLCEPEYILPVDYSITREKLFIQALEPHFSDGHDYSFFQKVGLLADALEIKALCFESRPTPWLSFFSVYDSVSSTGTGTCSKCGRVLPSAWARIKGQVFCLASNIIVLGMHLLCPRYLEGREKDLSAYSLGQSSSASLALLAINMNLAEMRNNYRDPWLARFLEDEKEKQSIQDNSDALKYLGDTIKSGDINEQGSIFFIIESSTFG